MMLTDDELMVILRANVGQPITTAMRAVEAETARRASSQGPACGENPVTDADLVGCGKHIEKQADVFRCTHCGVPFHRDCAERHFATDTVEHGTAMLTEQIRRLDAKEAAASSAAVSGVKEDGNG
jgi:hypothetical protein